MDAKFRPSGIEGLGKMEWGTHFCLFYETRKDLLDILIPYFKTGLANHEFCFYAASEPGIAEAAEQALHETMSGFEQYLSKGQIEIISHTNWYLEDHFDPLKVGQNWLDKLEQALALGYAGMRLAGNIAWQEKQDWDRFSEYECKFDYEFRHSPVIRLCAYDLNCYSAANMLDIIRHHQLTLVRRRGTLVSLEGAELKRVHEEVPKFNDESQQSVMELTLINEQLGAQIVKRRQADEALSEENQRPNLLLQKAPLAIVVMDSKGLVQMWNPAAERLFGWTADEVFGCPIPIVPEGEWQGFEELLAGEFKGEVRNGLEIRRLRKDGSLVDVSLWTAPLQSPQSQIVGTIGMFVDISERKQAEEALRLSEHRFHLLAETIPILVWSARADGISDYYNASFLQYLGKTLEEMQGWVWINTLHPDDRARSSAVWTQAFSSGSDYTIEYRIKRAADGQYRWHLGRGVPLRDSSGKIVRWYGTCTDIHDQKLAEDELRAQKEILQKIFDHAPVLIGMIAADGQWRMVNRAWEHIIGWTLEELRQPNFDVLAEIYPDPREYQRVMDCIASKSGKWDEFKARARDGRLLDVTFINIYLSDQTTLGFGLDITERKRGEEEIRRYAARMEALAEISRAFAEAGLDYHTILNTVARRTAESIGDACVITLFSEDKRRAFPVAFHHPNPESLALLKETLLQSWQGDTDERFHTLRAGNPVYLPVVDLEAYWAQSELEYSPYVDAVGISSVLVMPLKADGRVIGTLAVIRDRQGIPYTRDDKVLLQSIADRAAMLIQNAQLFKQVEGAREQLVALSKRLLEVQESERRALTTELHDRVGQNLTGLSINLQNMKALLSNEMANRLATKFDDVQSLVEDTTRQIRDIMAELYLPELEDYGLAAALETYAERAASRGNLELIAGLSDLVPPPLPSDVRIALFRAAQEAISNVLKHANAAQLKVSLQGEDGRVRLQVEDDGKGFDPNAASQVEAPSWGLKIMRKRIESIGGKVQIQSELGEGTRVIFEIKRRS